MGEIIAFLVLVAAVIVAVGLITYGRRRRRTAAVTDITVVTVVIPRAQQRHVRDRLGMFVDADKPGTVEFYDNQANLVRLVLQ